MTHLVRVATRILPVAWLGVACSIRSAVNHDEVRTLEERRSRRLVSCDSKRACGVIDCDLGVGTRVSRMKEGRRGGTHETLPLLNCQRGRRIQSQPRHLHRSVRSVDIYVTDDPQWIPTTTTSGPSSTREVPAGTHVGPPLPGASRCRYVMTPGYDLSSSALSLPFKLPPTRRFGGDHATGAAWRWSVCTVLVDASIMSRGRGWARNGRGGRQGENARRCSAS
jgi:hypothetical protein